MPGERDLRTILASLRIVRRPETYVYASLASGSIAGAAATITEEEGTTYIVEQRIADEAGIAWTFTAAWLTVEVHTALEGVGITAALAAALADEDISCNVLAGYYHDHLLVPLDRADDAVAALQRLREGT